VTQKTSFVRDSREGKVGSVKIPYYYPRVVNKAGKLHGYWIPCLARRSKISGEIEPTVMAKLGFKIVDCGEDGPRAWAIAESWNAKWQEAFKAFKAGASVTKPGTAIKIYPPGSLGEAFTRYKGLSTWMAKALGTRNEWEDQWARRIEPYFGDVAPATVTLEDLDLWYGGSQDGKIKGLLQKISVRDAYHAMKIWRALWQAAASMNYCDKDKDPSLGIRRKTPKARDAIWTEGEAVRLVKAAWRTGYRGLAAALAVAWDTSLSPVDVRTLTKAQMQADTKGAYFVRDRTKTGEGAIGTLSKRTHRLLAAYMATLPPDLIPSAPIFYTRGAAPGPKGGRPRPPAPNTKDTLGDDFRVVRTAVFGPKEKRKIMDFRRSGLTEALAGGASVETMAAKAANSMDQNEQLKRTYLPNQVGVVRIADAARVEGRRKLRGGNKT
jgi:hypothetical protein